MQLLIRLGGNFSALSGSFSEALALAEHLYSEFDDDGRGRVFVTHLTSGLSMLCVSSMEDKIDFAFALYDSDGAGFVTFRSLVRFMASVFKVLFTTSPELQGGISDSMTAVELAEVTAIQAFEEAGLRATAKLDKRSFRAFVDRGLGI